jgi:hypothetical protein
MIPYFGYDSELRRRLTREGGCRNVAGDVIMSQRGSGEVHPLGKARSRGRKKAETGADAERIELEYHGIYIFIYVYIHIRSAEQQLKKHMILRLNKQEQAIWSRG